MQRIKVTAIKGEHCVVTALFVCDHLSIKTPQRFIVDTGSVHTTVPETKAREMGVNLETLDKYKVKMRMGGIGGAADARMLGNVRLIFAATDNSSIEEKLQSVVVLRDPVVCSEEERNILQTFPCILGLDVIRRFTLRFEEKNSPTWNVKQLSQVHEALRRLLEFWMSVSHLFSPLTSIPHASAGVLPPSAMCGRTWLWKI